MAEIKVNCKVVCELDPGFVPASLWNKAYREAVAASAEISSR